MRLLGNASAVRSSLDGCLQLDSSFILFSLKFFEGPGGVGRVMNKRNMCLVGGKTKDVGLLRNENELTVSSVLFFAVELHVTNGTYHRDLEIPS